MGKFPKISPMELVVRNCLKPPIKFGHFHAIFKKLTDMNDPKFSDSQVSANSVYADQTASEGEV